MVEVDEMLKKIETIEFKKIYKGENLKIYEENQMKN